MELDAAGDFGVGLGAVFDVAFAFLFELTGSAVDKEEEPAEAPKRESMSGSPGSFTFGAAAMPIDCNR